MRPLDPLSSIKFKLSVVIVAAVGVAVLVHYLGIRTHLPLWAVGLLSAAVALVIVRLLARGMTSPLREMAAAATAMARGDYSRRVTASSRDEVGDLARAFNRMAAQLEETDRVRRDLLANVSHELRTPISALRAVLENLVDEVEPPDPETLRVMLGQVERLGRLVQELLDLSRLEAGVAPLERRAFEVEPLLERAVHEARVHAERGLAKRVRLSVGVEPGLVADGDPERVHQVVANLLENAVRHAPEGTEVMVTARPQDGSVRIEVADEGPGIPDGEAERVFERFYRTGPGRRSDDGGTGLGLAIARWIVELHGGDIRAERNDPTGCRIVVALPGVQP